MYKKTGRRMTVLCMYVGLLIGSVHFSAGADRHISKTALVGQHVILPCSNVISQTNCETTVWVYSAIELVTHGVIRTENSVRAKRMSLTSDCSLNISDIRHEDYGCYYCQQYLYKNGPKYGDDTTVCLFVKEDENGATTPNNKDVYDRDEKGATTLYNNGAFITDDNEATCKGNNDVFVFVIRLLLMTLALLLAVCITSLVYRRTSQKGRYGNVHQACSQ